MAAMMVVNDPEDENDDADGHVEDGGDSNKDRESDRGEEDIVNRNDKDECNDGFDADSATLL